MTSNSMMVEGGLLGVARALDEITNGNRRKSKQKILYHSRKEWLLDHECENNDIFIKSEPFVNSIFYAPSRAV